MPNLDLIELKDPPAFRKIAFGTWTKERDPSVYGMLLIDMTNANAYMEEFLITGLKVTPTHLVGRAILSAQNHKPFFSGQRAWQIGFDQ